MSTNRYLVRAAVQGWFVDHNGHPVARHRTRFSALADGRERATRLGAELVITRDDGTVEHTDRFDRAVPRDGKG
jgi:hypothetical protein